MNARVRPNPRRGHGLAALGFVALTSLFYAPLLLGLATFPDGDFTHHFLPFSLFQQQALAAGRLPLWNPYTYSGHPFLADIQAAVFYPLSNLVLGLTLPWTAVDQRLYFLQLEAVIQVALAGYFVYLLVHALTSQRLAAFTAGCAFAFSGYLTGYPPLQLAILRSAIWLPLLLYLLLQAMREPTRWRWWIGAGVTYAMAFLAGHPQTFLHISYTIAGWALFLLMRGRVTRHDPSVAPRAKLTAQLFGLGAFLVLATGLSAAQLLPSLEFSELSVRANVDYAYVSGGFAWQDTWQLLLPGVLTQFSPIYVGVIGLGLALAGIGFGRSTRETREPGTPTPDPYNRYPLFFGFLALIALLLAYGDNGFLYPLAYWVAPGWNLFRGQERAALLVALGLSVLIGAGMAALPTLTYLERRRLALLYAVLVAGGAYCYGILWQLVGQSAVGQWHYLLIAVVTMLLAMALIVLLLRPAWSRRRGRIIAGLVVLNLFGANISTNLDWVDPARKTMLAPEMAAVEQGVRQGVPQATGLPGRVYNEFRIYEDYGMRQQIEDVWGSSPLRLARYAALFDNFPLDRLWRLTGVTHVLTWRRELFEASELLAEFPQTSDSTYLHRLVEPNPRAWLVQQLQPATDTDAVALLADHTFDVEQIALLPPETLANPLTLPTGSSQIKIESIEAGQLRVTMESAAGGLLVLSENWLPGWQVRNIVSQATTQATGGLSNFTPYRVDLTLLGVLVPPGAVSFELVYWPQRVQQGLWISGGTLGLLVLLIGWRSATRLRSTRP